jgi:hypothetical protein
MAMARQQGVAIARIRRRQHVLSRRRPLFAMANFGRLQQLFTPRGSSPAFFVFYWGGGAEMADYGIQPRGEYNSPGGMTYAIVLKPGKIISRHCLPGEIIKIEPSDGRIMPQTDGLTEAYAERLVELGYLKMHTLRPGDKPISVRPRRPGEVPQIETTALKPQATAEKAVTGRQKAAI